MKLELTIFLCRCGDANNRRISHVVMGANVHEILGEFRETSDLVTPIQATNRDTLMRSWTRAEISIGLSTVHSSAYLGERQKYAFVFPTVSST